MAFGPVVLCYHAVTERWDDALAISPDTLERQLRLLLAARYRPIRAEDVLRNRRRTFHVTFDDAYRSVAEVMPVLERLSIPATIFVCTDLARSGSPMAVPELRGRANEYPEELCTMDWDALAALSSRGVEIGSHTVSHPHLPALSDAELERELSESREQIEARLGRPCEFLSYPFGEEDARVRAAAKAAGYTAAYGLRGDFRSPSPLALPRVDIYRADGVARFALKASPLGPPALTALRRSRARMPSRRRPAN